MSIPFVPPPAPKSPLSNTSCLPVARFFVMVTLASLTVALVEMAPPPNASLLKNVESTASNSAPSLAPAYTAPPLPVATFWEKVQPVHEARFSAKMAPPLPPLAAFASFPVKVLFVITVPAPRAVV